MAEAQLGLREAGVDEGHPAAAEGREQKRVEARRRERLVARVHEARAGAEGGRERREQLDERGSLVLRQVVGAPEARRVPEQGEDGLHHRARVDVPRQVPAAAGDEERPAVHQPPQVALDAPEVVALSAHHRDAQARRREAALAERARELVLEPALVHSIVPLAAVECVLRRLQQGAFVVALARRARARGAHQVHLARADRDVVRDAAGEDLRRASAVGRVEGGEVDGRVEAASRQQPLEVRRLAVAAQPLDPAAERVGERSAVEDGDRVAGGHEPQRELVAQEAVAADDERLHDRLVRAAFP